MSDRISNIVRAVLWLAVLAVGALLTEQRFRSAIAGDPGIDLAVFVDAARYAASGQSVYSAEGYVYLPPFAWLMIPFGSLESAIVPWTVFSLAACWATVAAVIATLWAMLSWWQRPLLAGVALVTLLFNSVTALQLWLGQNDVLVMFAASLAVLAASRQRAALSAVGVVGAALFKTWAAGLGLWLLRRGAPRPARGILVAAISAASVLLIITVVGGPSTVPDWIRRTIDFSDQQLLAYSVWGVGRHLFGAHQPVGAIVSWTLAVVVVALLVLILRRPGTDSLAMWNVAGAVILLIPVSHLGYRLLMLPLVWVWVAHLLSRPRMPWYWVMTAISAVFFGVTFRWTPLDSSSSSGEPLQLAIVILAALVLLAASVCTAAFVVEQRYPMRWRRVPRPAIEPRPHGPAS